MGYSHRRMSRPTSPVPSSSNVASRLHRRARVASYALGALVAGCAGAGVDAGNETSNSSVISRPEPEPKPEPKPEPAAPPQLPEQWPGNGSTSCVNHENEDPSITKFQYDENTFIFRENKCLNFEANFIYLLFGRDKVFMQDTGSIPQAFGSGAAGLARFARAFPIRETVEATIAEWLAAHPNEDGTPRTRDSIELLVTHSHSHGDHVQGDYQFRGPDGAPFPGTRIAGLRPADVASFFGLGNWPNESATLDLGDRKLEILPIPGHEASHVAVYDHGSKLLLSGDSLYPGHLFVRDWATYRASMKRLKTFMLERTRDGAEARPVHYVLGTHIEKPPEARKFYRYGSWIQEPERKLELLGSHVVLLADETERLGPVSPRREIPYDDFAIDAM